MRPPDWTRRILPGVLVLLAAVVGAGVVYEQWARRQMAEEFPPPGELVEFGGARSHLDCAGEGSPTVVLEAGLGVAGSRIWSRVRPGIAADTRVCSYDRAGILWSEAREEPRSADRIARELHRLLEAASVSPPYVLVGHSLGGLLARVYADRHPADVAGLVLVDPSHPGQADRYPSSVAERLSNRFSSLPPRPLFRAWAFVGGYRLTMPAPENPVQAYLWRTVPRGFLGEVAARDRIFEQAGRTGSLGDRPLVVLTADSWEQASALPDSTVGEFREVRRRLHAELAGLSSNSDHRVVRGASHALHRDDPDAVVAAVRDVLAALRDDTVISREEVKTPGQAEDDL